MNVKIIFLKVYFLYCQALPHTLSQNTQNLAPTIMNDQMQVSIIIGYLMETEFLCFLFNLNLLRGVPFHRFYFGMLQTQCTLSQKALESIRYKFIDSFDDSVPQYSAP